MKIYKENEASIPLDGVTYVADEDGIIDVPDHLVTNGLWNGGWVSAKGRQAQLRRERELAQTPAVNATAMPAKPTDATPVNSEQAADDTATNNTSKPRSKV